MNSLNAHSISQDKQLQTLIRTFNTPAPLTKKIKQRKQFILLKLPLFMTIYQKKGEQNFQLIISSIRLTKFDFGDIILSSQCLTDKQNIDEENSYFERTFNYILKGAVMLFTVNENQATLKPQFYKKLTANEYFGQKLSFGQEKLYEVKAVTPCYILQLQINTFYNTFSGHFQYAELKDKVMFLQKIWIFSQIRRSCIQKILLLSESMKYKKNQLLFKKYDIPQSIYVIVSGQLALFQKQENQKVKYLPFCLLNRSQICGLQEMSLEKQYDYNGIVNSEFLQVMIIGKQLYQTYLLAYIETKMQVISKLYEQKMKLKGMSIQYDKQYKEVVQYNKKRQADVFKLFIKGVVNIAKCPKIQVQKLQLNHVQQLKNPVMRQIRLKQIKERQSRQFSSSSLSTLTNNNYTKDKKLLINYLMKKQRVQRKANITELKYQRSSSSHSGIMKEIFVESSSAVKQHKRKLVKSRYQSISPPKN